MESPVCDANQPPYCNQAITHAGCDQLSLTKGTCIGLDPLRDSDSTCNYQTPMQSNDWCGDEENNVNNPNIV